MLYYSTFRKYLILSWTYLQGFFAVRGFPESNLLNITNGFSAEFKSFYCLYFHISKFKSSLPISSLHEKYKSDAKSTDKCHSKCMYLNFVMYPFNKNVENETR